MAVGDKIDVEKLPLAVGEQVTLGDVLMIENEGAVTVGKPTVKGAQVVAMVIGEGKAYLSAVLVLNPEHWQSLCADLSLDPAAAKTLHDRKAMHAVLVRVSAQTRHFPGYAHVRRVVLSLEPWTIENGFMTPTLKLRRNKVMETFNAEIDGMYEGM